MGEGDPDPDRRSTPPSATGASWSVHRQQGQGTDCLCNLQDIITDDEIISDSYDLKEVDGIVYEADCAMIIEGAVEVGT